MGSGIYNQLNLKNNTTSMGIQKQAVKVDKSAKWILIVGTLLMFVAPFFVEHFNITHLGNYGTVGDTIGGITNPISSLVGSILIYLALKAQIDANRIAQLQISENEKQDLIKHELDQIQQLFSFFESSIKNFTYDQPTKNNSTQNTILYGRRAIKSFFQDIEDMNIDLHNEEVVLKQDGVKEILSILKSAKLFLDKITLSKVPNSDKEFYKQLIYHELIFGVFPSSEIEGIKNLKLTQCEICNVAHGNYPPLLYDEILILKTHFKDSI